MIKLPCTLKAWQKPEFKQLFNDEIASIDHHQLPLQQGLRYSSCVSDESIKVVLINATENESSIIMKTSVFYSGIIAGCNCADDPTSVDTVQEHCELVFTLNKQMAEVTVKLISE